MIKLLTVLLSIVSFNLYSQDMDDVDINHDMLGVYERRSAEGVMVDRECPELIEVSLEYNEEGASLVSKEVDSSRIIFNLMEGVEKVSSGTGGTDFVFTTIRTRFDYDRVVQRESGCLGVAPFLCVPVGSDEYIIEYENDDLSIEDTESDFEFYCTYSKL